MSNFKTDVKGSVILVYPAYDLKTPIASVYSADDVEDMRGQILDAVQAAYEMGFRAAHIENPEVRQAIRRATKAGREQHAKELRALLNEGLNEVKKS